MPANQTLVCIGFIFAGLVSALSVVIRPHNKLFSAMLFIFGLLLIALAAGSCYDPGSWSVNGYLTFGPYPIQLATDYLSAFFLTITGIVTCCSALFSSEYLNRPHHEMNTRLYWCAMFMFVPGMAAVLLSANAVVFVVAWELMSLASAALVLSEYKQHKAQRAAMVYLAATRIATTCLCGGFLLMYAHSGSWLFSDWSFIKPDTWPAAALIILGLCIKAGMWPFHLWLPYAHAEAPGPVSALMSAVMVKVPIYAAIRLFVIGDLRCPLLVYALFGLAAISAFWGVLFALNQRDLKRLLAYSTVENIGMILLSLALTLWARLAGFDSISRIALSALFLQCMAHSLFKSLLFLGASSVDFSVHARDLTRLGGLIKTMPVTAATFIIGSIAICAVPPFNGFIAKWSLYQALFKGTTVFPSLFDRAACLLAIGILGSVGALSIACFARAIGVAFLGKSRTAPASHAREVPARMLLAQIILAVFCVLSGLFAPVLLNRSQALMAMVLGQSTANGAAMSAADLAVALPDLALLKPFAVVAAVTALLYFVFLRKKPREYITWDCGSGEHNARAEVAADSFAQPIARIFSPVLHHSMSIEISGQDRRHFPEKIHVERSVVSLLETRIYAPAARALDLLSRLMARLQAGSIHLYLLYACISLVLVLLIGPQVW